MFQHQGAIIRECISNKGLYVQQVFQALFALTSIIKVKSLKMLKLQITHQQVTQSRYRPGVAQRVAGS